MTPILKNILNIGFRFGGLGARFLLILFISKNFSESFLGEYSIFITTIILSFFIVGFDFYSYATRDVVKKTADQASIIRDQFIFYVFSYILFLPFSFLIFKFDVISQNYFLYFYLILIAEHLGQEFYRLFTTLQKPLFSNIILFIRTGLWVIVLICTHYLNIFLITSLSDILLAWLVGAMIANIISIAYLFIIYSHNSLRSINFQWILKGLKVSCWFFFGTMSYKIIEFSNRYIIDLYYSKTEVGIYSFFHQVTSLISVVVFTLVIMINYPKLLIAYDQSNESSFKTIKSNMFWQILRWSTITGAVILLMLLPLISFLDKAGYEENYHVGVILVLSNITLNMSFVWHYVLYAFRKDKWIFLTTIYGAILNLLLNFILIPLLGISGGAVAMLFSFVAVLIMKYRYSLNLSFETKVN